MTHEPGHPQEPSLPPGSLPPLPGQTNEGELPEGLPSVFGFIEAFDRIAEGLDDTTFNDPERLAAIRDTLTGFDTLLQTDGLPSPRQAGLNYVRSLMVEGLLARGRHEEAWGIVGEVVAPWDSIDLRLGALIGSERDTIRAAALDIAIGETNVARRNELLISLRNYCIEVADYSYADDLSRMFARRGLESDALEGWAAMQERQYPLHTSAEVLATLRDDELWTNIPMHVRQHLYAARLSSEELLFAGENDDSGVELPLHGLEDYMSWLSMQLTQFPDAKWLPIMTGATSLRLTPHNQEASLQLGLMIHDEDSLRWLCSQWIGDGYAALAERFALSTADYKVGAEVLLDETWLQGEAHGESLIAQVIADEDAPLQRRIGYLEFLRDRADEIGADPEPFQRQIDDLRR